MSRSMTRWIQWVHSANSLVTARFLNEYAAFKSVQGAQCPFCKEGMLGYTSSDGRFAYFDCSSCNGTTTFELSYAAARDGESGADGGAEVRRE